MRSSDAHTHSSLSAVLNAISRGSDVFFAALALLLIPTIISILARGLSLFGLVAFDISAIPWGEAWEFLEGVGALGAAARGGYWVYRKLTGRDKYYRAIWSVLDDAPGALPKTIIKDDVYNRVVEGNKKEKNRFQIRFEQTWTQMRESGVIVKADAASSEALYSLKEPS